MMYLLNQIPMGGRELCSLWHSNLVLMCNVLTIRLSYFNEHCNKECISSIPVQNGFIVTIKLVIICIIEE